METKKKNLDSGPRERERESKPELAGFYLLKLRKGAVLSSRFLFLKVVINKN